MLALRLDHYLARYCKTGDPRALARVFDGSAKELYRVGYYLLRDRHAAEDLVQQTFVAAIEHREQFTAGKKAMPWLCGILTNRALQLRRQQRQRRVREPAFADAEVDPAAEASRRELQQRVAIEVRQLPEPFCQALLLHLVHDLTPKEIADVLARPDATVRTQLARGLELLRRRLPAGVAGACVGVPAPLALDTVRAAVLEHAGATTTIASATFVSALIGGALMKNVAITAVAIALAIAVASQFLRETALPGPDDPARAVTRAIVAAAPASRDVAPAVAAREAERTVAVPDQPNAHGSFDLEFVWQDDGSPARNLHLTVQTPGGTTWETFADVSGKFTQAACVPGDYLLIGSTLFHQLTVRAGAETRERIEVKPKLRIAGIVADASGRGIEGAIVEVQYFADPVDAEPRPVASTAADGTFAANIDWGGYVWAHKPGYTIRECVLQMESGAGLRIVLERSTATVHGGVRTSAGTPAANARVVIVRTIPSNVCGAPLWIRCDGAGNFATDELGPGEHLLVAEAADHALTPLSFAVGDEQPVRLDVQLRRGATVFGAIRHHDLAQQAAIEVRPGWTIGDAGFVEALRPLYHRGAQRARTDDAGNYRVEHVSTGSVTVSFDTGTARGERELSLRDSEAQRCDFDATPAADLSGRVEDRTGAPLNDWQVTAVPVGGGYVRSTPTDADGRFTLVGCDAAEYTVSARPQNLPTRLPWVVVEGVRPGGGDLLLRAAFASEAAGTFVVAIEGANGQRVEAASAWVFAAGQSQGTSAELSLGDDGNFVLGPLPPDSYRITLVIPDHGQIALGEHVLPPRGKVELVARSPGLGTLELRFRSNDGRVAVALRCDVFDRAGNSDCEFQRTADGACRSRALPAGVYRVHAWGVDFAPFEQDVAVAAGRVSLFELTVNSASPIRFSFAPPEPRDPAAKRWSGRVHLQVATVAGRSVGFAVIDVDSDGPFAWTRGLPPGRYTFVAELNGGGAPTRGAFTVANAGEQTIEVRFAATRD